MAIETNDELLAFEDLLSLAEMIPENAAETIASAIAWWDDYASKDFVGALNG